MVKEKYNCIENHNYDWALQYDVLQYDFDKVKFYYKSCPFIVK